MTIDDRRAQLEQQLAAIPPDDQLPASATQADLAQTRQRRHHATQALAQFNAAVAAVAALGSAEDDARWRDQLTAWRATLCAERLTIKSPIRNPVERGREQNLALSIKCIDRGLGIFDGTGYELTNTKLGQLMQAAGYTITGADPMRSYAGVMPWHGSLPEVEKRIAALAERRAEAEATLDAVLMSDEERAAQEAESKQLRDAFNSMHVKIGQDGGLVAYDGDGGEVLDLSKMTELQRRSFERMDALQRGAPVTN